MDMSIVAALKLKLWLVLEICRESALLELLNLMSRLCSYGRFFKVPGSLANIFHLTVIAMNKIDASIIFNMLRFHVK